MKAFQEIIKWGTVKRENPFGDDELSGQSGSNRSRLPTSTTSRVDSPR